MTATPYPTINSTTFDSLPNIISYASMASNGTLGFLLLLLVFGVVFLGASMLGVEKRLLISAFFTFVTSVILAAAGMVGAFYAGGLAVAVFIIWIITKRYD